MFLLTFLLLLVPSSQSFKVLVYCPRFGHSHNNFMGRLADILVEEGHNVTSLIPVLHPLIDDGTTKSRIIHVQQNEETLHLYQEMMDQHADFFETPHLDVATALKRGPTMGGLFSSVCRTLVNDDNLMAQLKDDNYDVLITENFCLCGIGIGPAIGVRASIIASTSSLFVQQYEDVGVPFVASIDPSIGTLQLDPHSMWDRAWNLIGDAIIRIQFGYTRPLTNAVLKERFGEDYPTTEELSSHVAFVFTNSEPLTDVASSTLSRVIPIGGIGARPLQPLHQALLHSLLPPPLPPVQKWDSLLSLRPRTVLISFGTVAQTHTMPLYMKRAILETISTFPNTTFVWKYEKVSDSFSLDEASLVANVVLVEWMPQNDLLADSRVVAMLTHAGMGSTQEVATRGVPALLVPLFGDQPRNALALEKSGMGRLFDKRDLGSASKLTAALGDIIENEKYRSKASLISRMIASKPFSSRDLLVKYVAFAAEFGPSSSLRPSSHDLSALQYHNLDIATISVLVLFTITAVVVKAFSVAISVLFGATSLKQKRS